MNRSCKDAAFPDYSRFPSELCTLLVLMNSIVILTFYDALNLPLI
jgi:hypothetical protein